MSDQEPDFFRGKLKLWAQWFRQPAVEVAEGTIRLRRCRELTRGQLARKLHLRAADIARIESGESDMTLSDLASLAKALGATVLIELQPVEMIEQRKQYVRWWDRAEQLQAAKATA